MRLFNELNDAVLPDRRRADSRAANPVASGDPSRRSRRYKLRSPALHPDV